MNTIKSAIVGAVVAVAAMLLFSNLTGTKAQAQTPSGNVEYKIFQLPGEFKRGDMEAQLNALGKEGWLVRASVGGIVILAR